MTRHADPNRPPNPGTLYRNPRNAIVRGVCAGLADYSGIEVWIVRVLAVLSLFLFTLPTLVIYLIAAVLLPERPERLYENNEEESFWRGVRTDPKQTLSELRHRFRRLEQRLRKMESYVTSREFKLRREIDGLDGTP